MSDRIQFSPHTWASDGHLYTTSHEVAAQWLGRRGFNHDHPNGSAGYYRTDQLKAAKPYDKWRIPLTAARECYRYREGEPWVAITATPLMFNSEIDPIVGMRDPVGVDDKHLTEIGRILLHLRAALVCDGSANTLRQFHDWIEGGEA